MRRILRNSRMILTALLILTMIAGCTQTATPTNPETKPETATDQVKDSIAIATKEEPLSLGTCDHDSLTTVQFNQMTYSSLATIDMETLESRPDLAKSWEVENDTDWIFHLQEGVKFHHGKEFDSGDVVATIEYAKTFPASIPYTKNIAKVEAVDKYTVKIITDGPYANLIYDLGYHFNFILPADLIASGHNFSTDPVGTGPWKLADWSRGNYVTLERFDDYWNKEELPKVKTLQWKVIPEGSSRSLALEAGEVDVVFHTETADVERLKANPEINVREVNSVENIYLAINTEQPPFDDANLRLAIHCAIDRDAIIQGALNGFGTPNYTSIAMGYWGSWEGNAKKFDLDLAREYLKAWGGDPSKVTLRIMARSDEDARIGVVIQGCLAEIGINAEVVSVDYASLNSLRAAGDYDSFILSWSPSNAFTYVQRYHSDKRKSIPGACASPVIDDLIGKMEKELDENKRLELIHQIVEEVNDVSPQPSLYQNIIVRVWDKDLDGLECSGTGYMLFRKAYWKQ